MKKRFLAAFLAVLIITTICACNYVSKDDIGEKPFENTDTTGSNFEGTDEKTAENEKTLKQNHHGNLLIFITVSRGIPT